MGDHWRRRLQAQGISVAQWSRARAFVGSTLPQPCTVCGDQVQAWQRWHLDHVVPLSRGGQALALSNLGPAHARCNLTKGSGATIQRYPTAPPSRTW